MQLSPVIVSLPIADRRTSFAFYGEGLGFDTIGEPVDDGVPEPVQFALNDGVRLMLIPPGGFGWVVGGREVAGRTRTSACSSCVWRPRPVFMSCSSMRIRQAPRSSRNLGSNPWGCAGTFADPDGHVWTVTSDSFPT